MDWTTIAMNVDEPYAIEAVAMIMTPTPARTNPWSVCRMASTPSA